MEEWNEIRLRFWEQFYKYTQESDEAYEFRNVFKNRKLQPSIKTSTASFYPLNSGSGKYALYCEMKINPCGVADLRLDVKNDAIFLEWLTQRRDELEKVIGCADKWCECTGKTYTTIFSTQCDLENKNTWQRQFEWYCQNALALRKFLDKYRGK